MLTQELSLDHKEIKIGKNKAPLASAYALLKEQAALGLLTFQGKPLVVDLFSKLKPRYEVSKGKDGTLVLDGYLTLLGKEVHLNEITHLIPSTPPLMLHGILIKALSDEIPWRYLEHLPKEIEADEIEEIQQCADVQLLFSGPLINDPLPVLRLSDRQGAFANLYMHYDKQLFSFEDKTSASTRNFACEKHWEKDLIETGFSRKIVGESHYYCPLDKVGKSLAFLLELGWTVEDYKGNRVLSESSRKISAASVKSRIEIKGDISFGAYQADLKALSGAFNKRERFLDLGEGKTGLLNEDDPLKELLEKAEWENDTPFVNKFRTALVLEQKETLFSPDLEKIKNASTQSLRPSEFFKGTLRPYQQKGLHFLETLYQSGLHGVLGDDMGLGKTVQILSFLSLRDPSAMQLIIVPSSLLFNWKNECARFLPDASCTLFKGVLPEKGIVLASYHQVRSQIELFQNVFWDGIFLDEAQTIKNPDTQIARAIRSLTGTFRLSITGTLIENHAKELWSQFAFLMPGLLGEREAFEANLALGEVDRRHTNKIQRLIRPFILRRKKEEVAPELPPLQEQTCYITLSEEQRACYEEFLFAAKRGGLKNKIEIFETLLRLRQICCHPLLVGSTSSSSKYEALLADIETIAEEGKKALVFSQFTSMLHLIANELKNRHIPYVILEGATTDRETPVQIFQNDPNIPIFLISLKAGGVGLNLTAADYVLLYDPWWNEAAERQAISRAHRIGQTKPVLAKRYVASETIEEKLLVLKKAKEQLAGQLIQEELGTEMLSFEDLASLLDQTPIAL